MFDEIYDVDSQPKAESNQPLPTTNGQAGEEPYRRAKRGIWHQSMGHSVQGDTHLARDPIEPGAPQYRISEGQHASINGDMP
jgi:hypothetical protein